MRDRLIVELIQGNRIAWAALGALWVLSTLAVLAHRPGAGGARAAAWTWILLAVATLTSLVGVPLAAAIAVPRIRWVTVETPELVAPAGDTWRRLRGPTVLVAGPDVALPTIDPEGRWVLFGVLSGKPVEGLPAAEPAPLVPGAPRLCPTEGEGCRPWPVAWPDPSRALPVGELSWARAGDAPEGVLLATSVAYDIETSHYLVGIDGEAATAAMSETSMLELVGRLGAEEPREQAAVLFVIRRIANGRLRAARVVTLPSPSGSPPGGHSFRLQRAEVALTTGRRAFAWIARPALVATSLSLPLGLLALLLAPAIRRTGTRAEASAWMVSHLEALAVLAAGVAVAAPAVVAIASLWGSR